MNERLNITPLGPYIGALVENVELARPLGDGQFEQLYHALLKHQVLFFRNQPITPLQQRDLAIRSIRTPPTWKRSSCSIPTTTTRRTTTTGIPT
jgi:alpha-ketoglutarate-dependent taurine dioxygenase